MRIKLLIILSMSLVLVLVPFLSADAKEWQSMKSRYFIVYYRMEVPEDFVNTVIESAEDDYQMVSARLGFSVYQGWKNPVNLYIYKDKDDYINNGSQVGWSHGAAQVGIKTIKTFPSDQGFFDSLLPHELGHIILHEYLGENTNIPLWFNEGFAMFQEKAKRIGANKLVKEALLNAQFIPLTQLTDMRLYRNSDPKIIELFYAESASLVNFMINELGESRFRKLCANLRDNLPFEIALSNAMYMNMSTLNKKWIEFLRNQ